MLASIAAHVLCGHVREYRPLLARLSDERTRRLAEVFDGSRLETPGQAEDVLNPAPWFRFETQANAVCRPLSLQELGDFDHISKWSTKEMDRNHKLDAFDTKTERTQEVSNLTSTINILKCDAETHTDDIESTSALRKEMSSKDKLMIRRMRKYKLFPTAKQRKKLQQFMGTCRWTYNQAVAHFRETNVSNAQTLRDLYVTKKSKKKREYSEGMGPPPQWAFETPKNFRFNALRKFESGVMSAFSNLENGNISKFKIQFKSRKKDGRYFTFCEDAGNAKITYMDGAPRAMLSISKLKDIPIRCDRSIEIANEIQIMNTNGFWYAIIPQYVRPGDYVNRGRTIALDPGMKAFMTGVDLEGNALHIGRGNKEHLDKYRARIQNAQQEMSIIKNFQGHRSGRQWRAFARAKRAFHCATAKLNNCVKEMHYQTSAYLTKHYDTIILPVFNSKDMVKKSSARNHTFNRLLLGLKHFQFRKLLQAKCELMGKSLVVCSEMYSSQTCGRCSKLHLRLGSRDVFSCPRCEHVAGRDVNAAFNVLRFVCAGSLSVSAIHH
ncbi:Mitochondrial folate transporter/carrier [Phytophthora nicotianae]|uniref:Mitochondrial folate transporter/carrier n=1 Tax=Phytophthora nicotianae TaxID=4792 RepID=A0A0W8CXD3_PHYNI|nr:Mitochondrial folate transporter/carrier [Phytophthora nicotianae]